MNDILAQKRSVLERLAHLASVSASRPKVATMCETLRDKLTTPVRVGLFGLTGSGKRPLLNALAQTQIVPGNLDVPTLQLVSGPEAQTNAMLSDGQTIDVPGYPNAELLAHEPVFLTVSNPDMSPEMPRFLLVVCDDAQEDLVAGLHWAASRIDLALWCTRNWTPFEAAVWQAAPEHLRDHAILCRTGPAASEPQSAVPEFLNTFELGEPGETGFAALDTRFSTHLMNVIEEAITQDVLAAELFLQRYAKDLPPAPEPDKQPDPAVAETESVSDPVQDTDPRPALPPEATDPEPSAEAKAELAQVFRLVRSSALDLRRVVAEAPADDTQILEAFEDVFEKLTDYASELETVAETWPAIDAALWEARDLALLLRMESGPDQVTDAARLLLQLRCELEAELAA